MGLVTKPLDLTQDLVPTAAQWESLFDTLYTVINGNLDNANVDTSSIATYATAGTFTAKQTFSGGLSSNQQLVSVANAAGSVEDIASFDWDPADAAQMTDNTSGVAITFKMPDSADNQDIFGRLKVMSVSDTATSEEGEFAFEVMKAGTVTEVLTIASGVSTFSQQITVGSDGSGKDVIFYSGTSGDNLTWDASEEVGT